VLLQFFFALLSSEGVLHVSGWFLQCGSIVLVRERRVVLCQFLLLLHGIVESVVFVMVLLLLHVLILLQ